MNKFIKIFILIVCAVNLFPVSSHSFTAIDFTSVTIDSTLGSYSLGYSFTTNTDIIVSSLGFYDDRNNGLTESHAVGIFDAAQTLLVSTTVNPGDSLSGWFRYQSCSPTLLRTGNTYYIAAVTGSENYTWNPNGFTVSSYINFIQDQFFPSQSLAFPIYDSAQSSRETGWFGPNFQATPVPVPGAALLLGSGLLGLAAYGRWRLMQ